MSVPLSAERRAFVRWHAQGVNTAILAEFGDYQLSARLSPATVRNRASILKGLARTQEIALLEATTADLRRHIGREGITASTARTERNAIKAFYAFAVEDGHLSADPAAKLLPVKVDRGRPRPFSADQVIAMLTSGAYRRTRAMILLGWFQGFRVSQIARVRGTDIDINGGWISTTAKGGKVRRMPLHPVIAEVAMSMPRGWWFPARTGVDGPIASSAVTNLITKAKKRAGIEDPRLTPHSLRHGFGSELVEQGIDIRVIQELMMHEDISSTQIYTYVTESRQVAALSTLPSFEVPGTTVRRFAA